MKQPKIHSIVDLSGDLRDERAEYLNIIILITGLISMLLYVTFSQFPTDKFGGLEPRVIIAPLIGSIVSYVVLRRKHVDLASYIYLAGLVFCFAFELGYKGPNDTLYALLLLPIALASLTLDYSEIPIVAGLVGLSALIGTSAKVGLWNSLVPSMIPFSLYTVIAVVFYVKNFQTHERIHWTLDNQNKDNRRAEMFYDQSEQLQKAYLEVQHYSSRLEMVNKQLGEAQTQAEKASRAKSTFLSNMSHELRTPLNVIIGYSNSMLNMPKMFNNKKLSEAHRPYVQLIEENGHYLVELISDVLDLGKIEAGKLELHCGPTELPSLFKGVIATSVGLLKGKPIQLRSDFPDDLPVVWADPMRVRQIILNLMSNALKFTESGSVTLSARANGDFVSISVTDTGIGIPDTALAVIFDRFQQAEHDTDKKYGGTGLGLDISKQLSLMHGGNLTVTSEVGRGSVFTVTLPIMQQAVVVDDTPTQRLDLDMQIFDAPADAEQEMVLLVEDDMNTRKLMRTILEQANYVVVDTNTGEEAIDLASGLLPAAIILDVYLPDISGWDVLQMLKQNPETAIIPVVVCTADENRILADELYPSYYLRKPAKPDAILKQIDQAVRALKQDKVNM